MNVICPFMSTPSEEVLCKENCTLYIVGAAKNCTLSRIPIYYNQTRESLTVIANRLDTLIKNKV